MDTEIELDEDEDLENFLIQFLADQKNSDFDSVTEEYVVTDSGQTIPII